MAFTIGIAGITGKFARCVAELLLKHQDISIHGYCRDPSKLPASLSSSSQVHITKGESENMAALRSFAKGCEVVICCYLGDDDLMINGQRALIDACEAEGVSRYIASDYSVDYTKLDYGQLFTKDPMKKVKEHVDSKKTVKGVHVLIGVFMETFWSAYLGLWDPKGTKLRYWGSGEEIWEATSYGNAAEYVAAVALDRDAVGLQHCKYFPFILVPRNVPEVPYVLGDRKNINQIAETFESVYGTRPNLERLGSLDELYNHMHQTREKDPANILSYVGMFYQYYCTNGQAYLKRDLDNAKYPDVKPVTFEDFLKSHSVEDLADSMQAVGSQA